MSGVEDASYLEVAASTGMSAPAEHFRSAVGAVRSHLVVVFVAEAVVLDVMALPQRLSFLPHLLWDPAEPLALHYLLSHGYVVNRDFGYQYGLLNLLLGKLWFAIAPATATSGEVLAIALSLLTAAGIARFASKLRVGIPGLVLLAAALPFAIQLGGSLEAALLSNALAEHAGGRRDRALALAAGACFAKPTMGYVYGFLLILLIGLELRRERNLTLKNLSEALLPAAATSVALALVLAATFGARAVASTVLPLRGMETYRTLHFGFFNGGAGHLWYFPGVRIGYYLGTPTGFWLAGSLWLIVSAIRGPIARFLSGHSVSPTSAAVSYEMVFTCAALHVVFVAGFYGPPSSWTYYAYILVMGLAVASTWSWTWTCASGVLALVALVGNFAFVRNCYTGWRYTNASADTAYLWSSPEERSEWIRVQKFVSGAKATLLDHICGGELLSPNFEKPVAAFLVPGNSVTAEVDRKARQISQADFVVIPTERALGSSPFRVLGMFPQLKAALDRFEVAWRGKLFEIYARKSSSGPEAPERSAGG